MIGRKSTISDNVHKSSDYDSDRRVRRTKGAIQSAFSQLALTKDFDRIQIGDITRIADVARSTFYQHFASKDDVLCSVLSPIFGPMACAGTAPEPLPHLCHVAEHVWQNRRLGRTIFAGSARKPIVRDLAGRIEQVLGEVQAVGGLPLAYVAGVVAQWQIACLEEWLTGRHRCDAETWALTLCRGTRGLTAALIGRADG